MTPRPDKTTTPQLKSILAEQEDFLRPLVQKLMQEMLEEEMNETLQAVKSERSDRRRGYRSGSYQRSLLTRVGRIELRVPQDRDGLFSTEIFDRYQRSEKALVSTLIEMYVQGVSTRKVAQITEELCGHRVSASVVSRLNKTLDEELENFARRKLSHAYPYLILDARYEKVRENGVVRSQAVLIAIGISWDGRREVLATELDQRESGSSWKNFLLQLKQRGLTGVEFCVTDNHAGLRRAISEVLPEALWQRCYVHFLRNALDHLPRKHDDDCCTELRWIYDRRDINEARQDLRAWLAKWGGKYHKLCDWVESEIEETLTFYRLPREHHKHLKSTNMLERLNEEIKRRTHIIRTFPNKAAAQRLIRAVTHQVHEQWIDQHRYLNMDHLKEAQKLSLTSNQTSAA
ncbi:IS256 family transposase [Sulfuriroseicoccus oceanibius]|uniref:Mutator family transposase n=1 Tax=Sulfuriroseicoccus oceanibius TaxID=2707525 RepID=A0A7T7F386_9BACT|nr:IS256 family transposase [Sulfuriroseicoccus oceanibius]QQL45024.1 IS256 family transposase [Sulfuriroseicoccus oceanibius]QQL45226.1 IS256 family transposase [Sulfuriroseicoccus oceanibius]QQL45868.1 IS256 family transposase [Sulfuriroseicoccus oceanibius]